MGMRRNMGTAIAGATYHLTPARGQPYWLKRPHDRIWARLPNWLCNGAKPGSPHARRRSNAALFPKSNTFAHARGLVTGCRVGGP